MGILSALTGKKTYLVAAAGVVGAAASFATGQTSAIDSIYAALMAIGLATNRAGVKNDTQAVINTTTAKVTEIAGTVSTIAASVGALTAKVTPSPTPAINSGGISRTI